MSVCAEEGWVHGRSFQRACVTVSTFRHPRGLGTDRANRRQQLAETCVRRAVPQEPSTLRSSCSTPVSPSMAGWREAGSHSFQRAVLVVFSVSPVTPSPLPLDPLRLPLAHLRRKRHPNTYKHDGFGSERAWTQGARPAHARCSRTRNLPCAGLTDERRTHTFVCLVWGRNR